MQMTMVWVLSAVGLHEGAATQVSHLFCTHYCPRVRGVELYGLSPQVRLVKTRLQAI
jgi:hypothetical protein